MTCNRKQIYAAAVLGSFMLAATPAAACRTSGATGVKGQVVDSTMSLQNGKSCMIRHFTSSSDAIGNRNYPTTNISMTNKPARGSVSIEGNRIVYKASPGATGSDQFSYRTVTNKGAAYDYRVLVSVY